MHDKEAEGNCLNKKVLISISVFKSELVFKSWTHWLKEVLGLHHEESCNPDLTYGL